MYLGYHISHNEELQYKTNSLHSSWVSFLLTQTKNKTKIAELNTTKHSMKSNSTVLNLDGLDTICDRK